MNGNLVFLYTMKDCPWCNSVKGKLNEIGLDYIERRIDEHEYEYYKFKQATNNDMVPSAFMMRLPHVLKEDSTAEKSQTLCPENDFETIEEMVTKIINFVNYHEHDSMVVEVKEKNEK